MDRFRKLVTYNSNHPMSDKEFNPLKSYYQERLRQARTAFNLALVATAVSAGVSCVGIALLFSGNIPSGGSTAAGGITLSACFLKLAKEANDRLDAAASNKK